MSGEWPRLPQGQQRVDPCPPGDHGSGRSFVAEASTPLIISLVDERPVPKADSIEAAALAA